MPNELLKGRVWTVPEQLLKVLRGKFDSYEKTVDDKSLLGYTRMKNLLSSKKLSYTNMYNIKHLLEKNKDNEQLYELNGGSELLTWINDQLNVATTTVKRHKNAKDEAGIENAHIRTHYKDSSANPTTPTEVARVNPAIKNLYVEGKKVLVTEGQYMKILERQLELLENEENL